VVCTGRRQPGGISAACSAIELLTGLTVHAFPKQREYFVGMRFTVGGQAAVGQASAGRGSVDDSQQVPELDEDDWRLIRATQAGLPLVEQPYRQLADSLQLPETWCWRGWAACWSRGDPPHRRGAQSLRHRLPRQWHGGV
jgi:hypothetical protein